MKAVAKQHTIVRHESYAKRTYTSLKRVSFGLFFVLILTGVFSYTRVGEPVRVSAATSSTINFQARLMSAAGGIVADGNYSIAFNLYDVSIGGSSEWNETQATVAVKSGYLSVSLGSVTPFPTTIDWSQEHWLTMNVNGDGEMSPRLKLTAVPYAFEAGTAAGVTSGDTNAPATNTGAVTVTSGDSTTSGNTGALTVSTGDATSGDSGNITIDVGTASGTEGTINLGGTNASALNLGRSGLATQNLGNFTIQGGTATLGTASQAGSLIVSDGSSNGVTLTASGLGADYSLTLPTTAPSTDQCLRTNTTTASQLEFGACGSRKVMQTYNTYSINQAGTATTAQSYFLPTTNTAFSIALAGTTEIKMTRAGSFRSCSIFSSAAVTGGSVSVRFRKNGANTSTTNYCTLSTTNTRSNNEDLDPGVETFAAGDTIGIALVSNALTPTTLEHWVSFTVEFGTGSDTGLYTLQDAYNNSTGAELSLDSTRGALTIRDNATPIGANLLEVQDSTGATTYLAVTTAGVSVTGTTTGSGNINSTGGGLQTNSVTRIDNSGNVINIGNITATGALNISSGGAGALTLTSASGTIALSASTLSRTAAGITTIDLVDGSNTTLAIQNSGAGSASIDIDGGITAGNSNAFSVNADGDITSVFAALNGTSTSNGTSGAGTSTSLILNDASNFDIGNYVQVNSANCGGTGVNPCYAKITAKAVNTLTITPALRWVNGVTVNEYHIPEVGGVNTSQALANRYGRGYFIAGVATGNGTTIYNEDSIETSLDTFSLLDSNVTTLNIGSAATSLTIGSASTTVSLPGTVSVTGAIQTNGTTHIDASGNLVNIGNLTASGALTIASAAAGDITLNSASNKLVIDATDTSLERVASGAYSINLSDAADTTLSLNNSGAGAANLDLNDGALAIAGSTVLTNGRVLQNITGLTATGTVNLNDNNNANTNINTGTSSGTITLGGGSTALVINSSALDVTSGGALSGITGITQASGNFSQAGTGTFATGTGAVSLNGATTIATSTNSAVALTVNGTSGTAATALTIAQTGNAANIDLTNTARTTGSFINLSHTTSAFTGTGLLMNVANGSGTFSSGYFADFQVNSVSRLRIENTGALEIRSDDTSALAIMSAAGTSYLNVDTTGNIVQVGSSTGDATGIVFVLDSKNTSGDPTALEGAQYYNSLNGNFRCSENARGWTDCIGAAKPNTRRSTQVIASGTGTAFGVMGDVATITASTTTATAATTTEPAMISTATTNTNGNVASVSGNTNYDTSDNPAYQTVVDLDATTSRRVWAGLTSQTAATMGASATPAASYAAFRYDTSAGDTNWMCVTRGGAAAPTVTSSGIAASTTAVELEVILVQSTVAEFKINGVHVCNVSTTLPAASTMLRYSNSITNLANGAARTLRTGWVYVENN